MQPWYILVLMISSLFNAVCFLATVYAAWFDQPAEPWPADHRFARLETRATLLGPLLVTACLIVAVDLLANVPFSPLGWAKTIVSREYGP